MANRISFSQISGHILDRLFTNYAKLDGIQQQLATGKKLERASDDPVAVSQTMQLRSEVDQFTTFKRNIDDGLAYLGTVDSTLSTSTNLYQNMRELAIQASNDSNSNQNRQYIGQEVRGMFNQMVALSNTSFKGEYIFSGSNSQVPPYEVCSGVSHIGAGGGPAGEMTLTAGLLGTPIQIIDTQVDDSQDTNSSDANAYQIIPGTFRVPGLSEGTDFSVNYVQGTVTFTAPGANSLLMAGGAGIDMSYNWLRRNEKSLDGIANREIEEGVSARINSTATDIYGSNQEPNAWAAIITLMDGAFNNKGDDIRQSINKLDESMRRQFSAQASNGSRVQRFESTQTRNDDRIVYTSDLQSQIEDVDFAQAISDYNTQQAIYDASLQMGARAMQNTLMNFL